MITDEHARELAGGETASGHPALQVRVENDSYASGQASHSTCTAIVGKGGRCGARPLRDGSGLCWAHSPKHATARAEAARRRKATVVERSQQRTRSPASVELSSPRLDALRADLARARLRLRVRTEIEHRLRELAPSDRVDVLLDLLLAQELAAPDGPDVGVHASVDEGGGHE